MALKRRRDNKRTSPQKHAELWALVWLGVAALLALVLIFYDPAKNPWLTTDTGATAPHAIGTVGSACGYVFLFLLGLTAYLIPAFLLVHAVLLFVRRPMPRPALKVFLLAVLVVSAACLLELRRSLVVAGRFEYLAKMEGPAAGWATTSSATSSCLRSARSAPRPSPSWCSWWRSWP